MTTGEAGAMKETTIEKALTVVAGTIRTGRNIFINQIYSIVI